MPAPDMTINRAASFAQREQVCFVKLSLWDDMNWCNVMRHQLVLRTAHRAHLPLKEPLG